MNNLNNEKKGNENYNYHNIKDTEENSSFSKNDQRRCKSNTNIEITFKSLEDEYSHLDKINPILSPNNNLFLQTDFHSIEFNNEEYISGYKSNNDKIHNKINSYKNNPYKETTEHKEKNNNFTDKKIDNSFKNDRSPLRKKIANSNNTIDTVSKYSNLNNLGENSSNNNFIGNNKPDIFESINNLYISNINKAANLENLSSPINESKNNNNTLNNDEATSKISQNILLKNSPLKKQEENTNKNIIYTAKKNQDLSNNNNNDYSNYENYKRNLYTNNLNNNNFDAAKKEKDKSENDFSHKNEINDSKYQNHREIKNVDIPNNKYGKVYSENTNPNTNNDMIITAEDKFNKSLDKNTEYAPNLNTFNFDIKNTNNDLNNNFVNNCNNIEKNNINNNFIFNNRKNTSFLPSESMLSKNINKQKNRIYNLESSNENIEKINKTNNNSNKPSYQNYFQNKSSNKNNENDSSFEEIKNLENIVFIRSKLESKKNQLKQLKKEYDEIHSINTEIINQISELEKYKSYAAEKIESLEYKLEYNENKFINKESDMINIIKNLEDSKNFLEDKYVKSSSEEKLKEREMELLNQKIKDMELIFEENENEYFFLHNI